MTITHVGRNGSKPAGTIWGLGKFLSSAERYERYGTWPDDELVVDPAPLESRSGIRLVANYAGSSLAALQEKSINAFITRLETWQTPNTMTFDYLGLTRNEP